MIRPGDWLRTGLLALALLAFAPVRSALHADNEDVAETLARAAAFYASTDKTDLCEDLLELSIVLDPKGKEAIILKSKLKRELKVDAPEGFKVEDFVRELQDEIDSADNGYVTAALALAALAIDPENRVARVELFRLRNRELEGDLDRIVETLGNGGFFKIDKAPKPESRTL